MRIRIRRGSKSLLFLFAVAITFLSYCSSTLPVVRPTSEITSETKIATATESLPPTLLSTSVNGINQLRLIPKEGWPKDGFPTDAAKITVIMLEENLLKIDVTYRGDCQEHTFALYAESAFLQSIPEQGLLYLSHDSHGDSCTDSVEKLLSFDLNPLEIERNDPRERPLLLRVYEPVGRSFAMQPYMPLVEWP